MTFYSRAEWGGNPPANPLTLLERDKVEGIALHWPAMTSKITTVPAVKEFLRATQKYHVETRGWSDIAYQVAFDQLGNVYALRGMRYRSAANGDRDVNERYGAFLLILAGTVPGNSEKPSNEMVSTVNRWIGRAGELFPASLKVVGHQDIRPEPTACPGTVVEDMIRKGRFHG